MENYEGLQVPGCDSDVELSYVASSSEIWFPDSVPAVPAEPEVTDPQGWLPQDEDEFFWQELTEEEISQRRGIPFGTCWRCLTKSHYAKLQRRYIVIDYVICIYIYMCVSHRSHSKLPSCARN